MSAIQDHYAAQTLAGDCRGYEAQDGEPLF